jgi:epoxyqueuosine reductase
MVSEARRLAAGIVKQIAHDEGFHLVGITSAEPFVEDEHRTLTWLADGRAATMRWLNEARTREAHRPGQLVEGARSIIVLGVSYANDATAPQRGGPRGRIARYARGVDYHDIMRKRIRRLSARLTTELGTTHRARTFVDLNPLSERSAAVRAGLGFIGKNTNLLTRSHGSWVLLGALVTTLDLEPDPPATGNCGNCRLCLDACPTGALPEPFVLDANRCISYLTIEHRGAIDPELRPLMGDHLFGCDICQDVCPWNAAQRDEHWPTLGDRPELRDVDLVEAVQLPVEEFRLRFAKTAIKRTKRAGFARNAAIALGNSGCADAVPALEIAMHDDDPIVREHAAWALGRLDGHEVSASRKAASTERDPTVRRRITSTLDGTGGAASTPHTR